MVSKTSLLVPVVALGTIFAAGCATKGYVRAQVQPVNTKVDQVSAQTQQQFKDTNGKIDSNAQREQQDFSQASETANAADSHATQAINIGHQNSSRIGDLNNTIANLDAYKPADKATVLFGFNRHNLTEDAKSKLDTLAADVQNQPRYFITIQGYTDQTGPANYNDVLSRERADAVIRYLVGEKNIPIYRIHMIGLGKMDLVNGGQTREDRKDSRRCEVSVYVAPALPSATTTSADTQQ